MPPTKRVARWYVGPFDAIETVTLDGRRHDVAHGGRIDLSPADAELFDLQPTNWSAEAPKAADPKGGK